MSLRERTRPGSGTMSPWGHSFFPKSKCDDLANTQAGPRHLRFAPDMAAAWVVAVKKGRKFAHITEHRFPHIVEIVISPLGLDPQTSREIVDFHRSRNIQVRFGHAIKNVCRWCFSDAATAEAFKEQFNGKNVVKRAKTTVKRTLQNIIVGAVYFASYCLSSFVWL
jgi:hypothetical protein